MDLTTAASVNARRGRDAADDATLLGTLITEVSADAEAFLGRHAEAVARTEVYTLRHLQGDVRLNGYPLTAVSSVSISPDLDFAASEILAVDSYHTQDSVGRLHLVRRASWSPTYLQVAYTGGMGASTAAFMAAFPDISGAVESAVLELLKRADQPGVRDARLRSGGVSYDEPLNMLPLLKRRLEQHKRTVIL